MKELLDRPKRWAIELVGLGVLVYLLLNQRALSRLSDSFTRDIRAILDLAEQPKPDEGQEEGQEP